MLIRKSGIILPKDDPQLELIKSDLTRKVFQWDGSWKTMTFYEDMSDYIVIPRFYPALGKIRDDRTDGDDIEIESKIKPLNSRQEKVMNFLEKTENCILRLEPGSGKAQPIYSKILTPIGWKNLQDIQIGDNVIDPVSGRNVKVLGVFPQGKKEVYKLTFNDGATTFCCNDHLWKVKYKRSCIGEKEYWKIKPLNDLKNDYYIDKQKRLKYFIPITSPIEFENQEIKIDPYLLGCLLGDGTIRFGGGTISLSSRDKELIETCSVLLDKYNLEFKKDNKYDYRIRIKNNKFRKKFRKKGKYLNPLKIYLDELGLLGKKSYEKFIPNTYKFNSMYNRISILQGLLDTDGYVSDKKQEVSFSSTSYTLCKDVKFIVDSLGGKSKIYPKQTYYTYKNIKKKGRPSWVVNITLDKNIIPFRLSRKVKRYNNIHKYPPSRAIKDIKYIGKEECQCIKVDSDDGLYITDDFIVTHNTVTAIETICRLKKRTIIFAHKTELLDQWRGEFLKHTNLTEDDIQKVNTDDKKFDGCLKKKIILCTPHTISVAIRLNKKDFIRALLKAGIGICFIDECHVGIGPEEFSKSSIYINAKRIYGLSATPFRPDGNDDIIRYHLGEVKYFPPEKDELINPKVLMVHMPFHVFETYNMKQNLMWGGRFQNARYWNLLAKQPKYIHNVASIIKRAYTEGRNILVLGNRVQGLMNMAEACNIHKKDIGIFMSTATSEHKKRVLELSDTTDLKEAFYKKRVVFSTYGMARDGNNRKDLDFLVLCIPTGNIEQAVGRVQRELKGKRRPIVIDLVDTQSPKNKSGNYIFEYQAQRRKEFYAKMGWKVETIFFKE